ncbi:hypothetical protein CIT292_08607 [Citrobacter youngae ATCC 29220]|uniref:Uncharacterized protein n=1 Tax=Citrobacter youngae ATCC 29220 TaxID=500640 RepID=D4BDN9_9ENTR|nr:hypothetical protein CIT292_08607 [Citrobacter youngae ATCC 29220]
MRLRIPLSPLTASIKHAKRGVDTAKHWFLVRQISIISRNLIHPQFINKP